MSRAFVKDLDGAAGEDLPELAVSPHRNLVTPLGLADIEAKLRRLDAEAVGAKAADDKALVARIERDLRYYRRRRATAEVVPPGNAPSRVRFGCRVLLETGAGERIEFRIVGEDESDPANGLISYVSPLAESLMGGSIGDHLPFRGGEAKIVAVDPA